MRAVTMGSRNLFITGVKLLLTVVFVHRCIVIFERWSLGRTEKFQTSQLFTGEEPFPAFTFKRYIDNKTYSYKDDLLGSFLKSAYLFSNNKQINLLENAEDYFTEFIYPYDTSGANTMYVVTLHVGNANLSDEAKPQITLDFELNKYQNIFFIATHPPHHMRYNKELMYGVQRQYVNLDEVESGEKMHVYFSFSLTKIIDRDGIFGCKNDFQELDTCQRKIIEEKLGCAVPGRRQAHKKVNNSMICTLQQMTNLSTILYYLNEETCAPACELYVPHITRESHRYYNIWNSTGERRLGLTLYTDQLAIPVEETILSYDSLDAMADIGGYLGLLLGASCLSMVKNNSRRISRMLQRWNKYAPSHPKNYQNRCSNELRMDIKY